MQTHYTSTLFYYHSLATQLQTKRSSFHHHSRLLRMSNLLIQITPFHPRIYHYPTHPPPQISHSFSRRRHHYHPYHKQDVDFLQHNHRETSSIKLCGYVTRQDGVHSGWLVVSIQQRIIRRLLSKTAQKLAGLSTS